jgi:Protein of unknown function (DUF2510)
MADPSSDRGWYPDPEQVTMERWWDGRDWTEHRRLRHRWWIVVGYVTAVLAWIIGLCLGIGLLIHRQFRHGLAIVAIAVAAGAVTVFLIPTDGSDDEAHGSQNCGELSYDEIERIAERVTAKEGAGMRARDMTRAMDRAERRGCQD